MKNSRLIAEAGGRQTFQMPTAQMSEMADELNIDKKATREPSMKIYGTGRSAQSSFHTDLPMSNTSGDTHHAKASSRLHDNPSFIYCNFSIS
jgi:hypothetical protein